MLDLGFVSYGLAATSFLILTLLLLTSWHGRAQGARLVAACAVTALWAGVLAYGSGRADLPTWLVLAAECVRNGAWFVVLTGLTRSARIAAGLSKAVHAAWLGGLAAALLLPTLSAHTPPLPGPLAVIVATGLLLALLGLVLLEQIYRNSRSQGRYAIKFLVIALGLMFAYDLFLYSQAQLLKSVDAVTWAARGFVVAMTVPMIALAARRNPQWSLDVFVSRQVVFYSTSILAIGFYLLLMALGGYVIRLYGGTWGRVAQLVFIAGAGVVLASLVASNSLRRRLQVFLAKHFYRNKYDYRVEWLRFIDTLSAPEEGVEVRANAVRAIAQIIGSPAGLLFLKAENGDYQPVAAWPASGDLGRRFQSIPAGSEFIEFLARRQWVVDSSEHAASPDSYQHVALPDFVSADPVRHRFVLPLLNASDLIGFVVLAAPPPPFRPTFEDRDLLKTVGRHVATHLAQHESDRKLADSRQFEAYHRLTAFVMHDLKNLAAQLSLIVSNAAKHKHNPEFVDDAIGTIANSTARMQRLIEQLQRREVQTATRRVDLHEVARRAVQRCCVRQPEPHLTPDVDDGESFVEADQERLTMVLEHVIRNAQEATPDEGRVTVSVVPGMEWHSLVVTDTGGGMSQDFVRERLFKPFDTTKGSKGMGIGAYQVREYVQLLGGSVLVESREGEGTRMELRLPARSADRPTETTDVS